MFFKKKVQNVDKMEKEYADLIRDKQNSLEAFDFTKVDGGYSVSTNKNIKNVKGRLIIPEVYENEPVVEIGVISSNSATSIVIPDSVTKIHMDAFTYCENLTFNEYDNAYYVGNENNNYMVLVKAVDKSISSCAVHEDTKFIHDVAFEDCEYLESVTFDGDSKVESIGSRAFYECNALENIVIPESVKVIGDGAFYCDVDNVFYEGSYEDFRAISIGDNNSVLTNYSIYHYIKNSLDVPTDGNYYWHYVDGVPTPWEEPLYDYDLGLAYRLSDDESYYTVYNACTRTEPDLIIPSTYNGKPVLRVGRKAFIDCDVLKSVTLPDCLESIDDWAFANCYSLTDVKIPETVKAIGEYAFSSCEALTEIVVPDGVVSLGGGVFEDCDGLEKVIIGDGVLTIGADAFSGCSSLESLSIPSAIKSIGEEAFNGCGSLSYYEFDNARYLGNKDNNYLVLVEAMDGDITSCKVNASTKIIADLAFSSCFDLEEVSIPNGVISIGNKAFKGCDKLMAIDIPNTVACIGKEAFYDCSALIKIIIPDSVDSLGDYAFFNCSSLTSVTIGNGVKKIGVASFVGCVDLTEIIFGDVENWSVSTTPNGVDKISISATDLTDSALVLLTKRYCENYWFKD